MPDDLRAIESPVFRHHLRADLILLVSFALTTEGHRLTCLGQAGALRFAMVRHHDPQQHELSQKRNSLRYGEPE